MLKKPNIAHHNHATSAAAGPLGSSAEKGPLQAVWLSSVIAPQNTATLFGNEVGRNRFGWDNLVSTALNVL
ncbi:hypothetical protein VT06_08090 [Arsukibacterium sp. MJ3]|nr:hypothetical protein VT06_08090 [Arsukibacterium sp. MJ3]